MMSAQLSQQRRHLFFDEPAPFSNNSLHLVKLFDGLFMGNHHAGKEPEFLTNNKIALAVNLHPLDLHVPARKGLAVHPFELALKKPEERLNLLPLLEIIAKMEFCLRSRCEGVVVVGRIIDGRVVAFAVAYLMVKYCWDLSQAFAFVQNKHPLAEIQHKDMTVLKQFNSHPERRKLSEPFETELTTEEETVLRNTMANSATKHLPDFHGLNYQREEMSRPSFVRKVKFARQMEEVIGSEPARKSSAVASPAETSKRLTNVEKKLRQFIKEKCQSRQEAEAASRPAKSEKAEESIFIKSKDILCRVPRKRAASRTEESPHLREKLRDNFLAVDYKNEDLFRRPEQIKVVIPIPTLEMHVSIAEKSHTLGEEEGESQRREKAYVIHNSKRYRGVKKCRTEESAIDAVLKEDSPEKKRDTANAHLFKIKSNKTSYKKFKASHPNLRPVAGKESEKSMRPEAEEPSAARKQNIINVNLNLQIDNINLVHERSDEEEDRPRFPSRQQKKGRAGGEEP